MKTFHVVKICPINGSRSHKQAFTIYNGTLNMAFNDILLSPTYGRDRKYIFENIKNTNYIKMVSLPSNIIVFTFPPQDGYYDFYHPTKRLGNFHRNK